MTPLGHPIVKRPPGSLLSHFDYPEANTILLAFGSPANPRLASKERARTGDTHCPDAHYCAVPFESSLKSSLSNREVVSASRLSQINTVLPATSMNTLPCSVVQRCLPVSVSTMYPAGLSFGGSPSASLSF